jgi:two-component system cell cycle response regulator
VDDIALVKRVRNLARLKMLTDEMLMRSSTEEQMGLAGDWLTPLDQVARRGRILVIEDHEPAFEHIEEALQGEFELAHETDPARAMLRLPDEDFDLIIVSLDLKNADGLRLCSQVRSTHRTRHLPILVVAEPGDDTLLLRGLDMGVNDYIVRPMDANELLARARTQVKRKRYVDHLRVRLEHSVEMAILDPLTGLHNRRYLASHLATLFEDASQRGKPLSILIIDIDHFKAVNDSHGHGAGDTVLREFADRIRRNTRGIDLACRLGGEEFVVVLPDCDLDMAVQVGERLRQCIAAAPFDVGGRAATLPVTASVGVSALELSGDTPELLLKRADQALYCAKRDGRNRVVADAARVRSWLVETRRIRPDS